MVVYILVKIGLDNGLLTHGTKLSPQKMLTWDIRHPSQSNSTENQYGIGTRWRNYNSKVFGIFLSIYASVS